MEDNFIFQDYLTDLSLCDMLIDYHSRGKQYPGAAAGVVNKEIKDSTDVVLQTQSHLYQKYANQLKSIADRFVVKYPRSIHTSTWGLVEQVQLQRYDPNQGYHEYHCERDSGKFPFNKRHLVFMTYLNDVTDKGQTEFMYQKVAIEPKKGLTLIWPTDWTHTHRGIASPTQTKYIITGWLSFLD